VRLRLFSRHKRRASEVQALHARFRLRLAGHVHDSLQFPMHTVRGGNLDVGLPTQCLYAMQPRLLLHEFTHVHQRQRLDLLSLRDWLLPGRKLPV
jgi:hypothetical protein